VVQSLPSPTNVHLWYLRELEFQCKNWGAVQNHSRSMTLGSARSWMLWAQTWAFGWGRQAQKPQEQTQLWLWLLTGQRGDLQYHLVRSKASFLLETAKCAFCSFFTSHKKWLWVFANEWANNCWALICLQKLLYEFWFNSRASMLVRVYNPSYWGGRGRRIKSSRPVWAKLVRPYLKKKIKTRGLDTWFKL
jgi:hypothetical protein